MTPVEEKQLMARIAAAIWASIGAFGLLVTFEPMRATGTHVTELRGMAAGAAVIAAALLLLPSRHLSKKLSSLLLVVMIACISALAYAGGAGRGDLTILYTFVVVFSAYFFRWRISAAHLGLIAVLLTSRLFLIHEADSVRIETIRFAILLPSLISVWALVSLLRKGLVEREARLQEREVHDPETGLLSAVGLDQAIDSELARATRHARPLSLIYLELHGPAFARMDSDTGVRLATTIARALVGRIRVEDRAARLGLLKFAVLAVETSESEVVANALADRVRRSLLNVGYESGSFSVAIGWAHYQYEDVSKEELLSTAEQSLSGMALSDDGSAPPAEAALSPVPVLTRSDGESIPPPSS